MHDCIKCFFAISLNCASFHLQCGVFWPKVTRGESAKTCEKTGSFRSNSLLGKSNRRCSYDEQDSMTTRGRLLTLATSWGQGCTSKPAKCSRWECNCALPTADRAWGRKECDKVDEPLITRSSCSTRLLHSIISGTPHYFIALSSMLNRVARQIWEIWQASLY